MIHGFGGDGLSTWHAQMTPLGERRRVIVPDLLWFGKSAAGTPGLDTQVRAVIALLDSLGVRQADVMGVSYGGFVTLELMRTAPERVGRAIIVDSPGWLFTPEDEAAMIARMGAGATEEIFVPKAPEDLTRLFGLAYLHPPKLPPAILKDVYNRSFAAHHDELRRLLADLKARRATTEPLTLATRPPPLVLWGEQDPVFPLEIGKELATALGAELDVIPDTAHAPCVERPGVCNALLLRYLDGS